MQSLSVCMMVQNVGRVLPIALDSLGKVYDELIVVDGGSSDNTIEIAEKFGAKVIHSEWSGNHSFQRNVYLQQVKTDWVYVLDSDEFIDTNTIDFLSLVKSKGDSLESDNFWFPRKWICSSNIQQYLKNSPHHPDWQRRLFKYTPEVHYSGLIHESIHGLKHTGQTVPNCSIYHLDLFLKTELERKDKVRKYMNVDPTNGAIHFYLPNTDNVILESWDIEKILPSTKILLVEISNKPISAIDKIIPPEIKNDEFYTVIEQLAANLNIRNILEIGSSSGTGSTEAFVKGIRKNNNKPNLFCMEVSQARFSELQKRYQYDSFVKCYRVSSVVLNKFPSEGEVIKFYEQESTGLNQYPLDTVLSWLQQDIAYVNNSNANFDGIEKIKRENQIDYFDLVLIDGSEFTGKAELDAVYGSKLILLDDINTFKNYDNLHRLLEDETYDLITKNHQIRNGYAIFAKKEHLKNFNLDIDKIKIPYLQSQDRELPIHFFTIVLNGEPFIKYHIEVFKHLPFKWHWHIIEGVADLKNDTGWSLKFGGNITEELHINGRSNDGTTAYLDELVSSYPDRVTVYRKPEGTFWNGKREMINEPILHINEECLLWQIDVDELWTVEQLRTVQNMFINHPEKTAAFYWCWYFVGQELLISTRNCYAQNPQQEWLRTWRYKPGMVWAAHEPPILVEPLPNGEWKNVAAINSFSHQETEEEGLVFQHFAYVMPKQLQFKEQYYGYKNALKCWNRLQEQNEFPVLLREFLPWVGDNTTVAKAESLGIHPIARQQKDGNWHFIQPEMPVRIKHEQLQPKILVDGVFFQLYNTGIARVWRSLLAEWVKTGFANRIVVLDRNNTAPKIDGVWYRTVPAYSYDNTESDRAMLQQICDEEGATLFTSTYYTTPLSTPSVMMVHDMIPEVMNWDLNHPMWREKRYAIERAYSYIAVSENTSQDLQNVCPNIAENSISIAYNGIDHQTFQPASSLEINNFKSKYGIQKPYFLLVGAGGSYKNTILFLKAFSQLPTKNAFDLVLTGASSLTDESRSYTAGSTVHFLQLSDAELRLAYSGAIALVYPSKYEGFGLPILEALACGCPVITCPNASIPEVAGEAALYVDDEDVDAMADALCEVQKPTLRELLISAGLEQAQKFSWAEMANQVSSALIHATLSSLNLRENNLIIFPDWTQPEEELGMQLMQAIHRAASSPEKEQTTLLIELSGTSEEEANLMVSSVAMNLMMEAELDVSDGPEISLVGELAAIQWQALLPKLQGRIALENDNRDAIARAQAQDLLVVELTAE